MAEPAPTLTSRAFQPPPPGRPSGLRALCAVLGLLVAASLWLGLAGDGALRFGAFYRPYVLGVSAGVLGATWGLWHGRRWGAWALLAVLSADAGVTWSMGEGSLVLSSGAAALVAAAFASRQRARAPG